MPKIFISYRRADSKYVTDNIYEHMVKHFGRGNVFLDVGSIPFGIDFRKYLHDQIEIHDVVLVIIGPDWVRIMKERADQTNDFVRIEIENALKLKKLVIPVLVKDAEIPDFPGLPESIQELQWRNIAEVQRQPRFEEDCNRLVSSIKQSLGIPQSQSVVIPSQPRSLTVADILQSSFEWVSIPAGKVTLVPDDSRSFLKHATSSFLLKKTTFDLSAFAISKYPITNIQYSKFVKEGGYNNSAWWTKEGWQFRQERNWSELAIGKIKGGIVRIIQ